MAETLVEQARRLSSGTMATLAGARDYATLDVYRDEFARFCASQPQSMTWQEAWRLYTGQKELAGH